MITLIESQSLLDIAVQESGNVLCAFEYALSNNLSITEGLEPGQKLDKPNSKFQLEEVSRYFKGKGKMIVTGFNGSENIDILPQLGIGTMTIGTTFIVG